MKNLEDVKIFIIGTKMLESSKEALKQSLKGKNKLTKISVKF